MSQTDSRRVSFASTTFPSTYSFVSANTVASRSRTRSESIMSSRPKSMPDFSALMDASMPLFESKTNTPRSTSPERRSPERRLPERRSPERRLPERRLPERRLPERRSPERRLPERRSPERRLPERRSPETRSPETRSPKTRSPKTRSPKTRSPKTRSPERAAGHSRKKPSMSLAQGLIINGELHPPKSPYRHPLGRGSQDSELNAADNGEESLFYAYALKSDYANSPPYLLTFATSDVCAQWWSLVQRSYPESTRPGAQLFVLKTDDMQAIQDDPRFFELRSKWFFTSQDRSNCATPVIPLQGTTGHLVARAPLPQAQPAAEKPASTAVDSLAEKLERLSSVVESSAEHIHALSVAQSAGLQRMQEINESNSTQIKALAESQAKLQALIDQNASHYIALSNTSFESHEQVKHVLQATTAQIQSLSGSQAQLAQTCKAMVRTIETLSTSVDHMTVASPPAASASETSSVQSTPPPSFTSAMANRISPAPRKLNRRIRGVWYEYDNNAAPTVHGAPRKLAPAPVLSTPPKTPTTPRTPRKLNQK
ncbi:uncharacterized protein EKO05_0010504 [Ascochyta rabiei]|uniref:uncharacterized protein n=1 Tax=Didymella rabiei TaxID=5454 RepID=UPI0018FF23B6|nr:uncharacterized protein EKO05_0010504 [Ascochyta rabiei]UPX20265.1 hypothetical protein EKO05_0010504 [Ascochyta rabiei]